MMCISVIHFSSGFDVTDHSEQGIFLRYIKDLNNGYMSTSEKTFLMCEIQILSVHDLFLSSSRTVISMLTQYQKCLECSREKPVAEFLDKLRSLNIWEQNLRIKTSWKLSTLIIYEADVDPKIQVPSSFGNMKKQYFRKKIGTDPQVLKDSFLICLSIRENK